jgi:NAD(P)-dependent dehydrogenase (short-subunit alcohol dehydrogenase family)
MARNTRFAGKVALVTGAAAGLGRASALGFASEGARVAVVDINAAGGAETVSLIENAGGEARFIQADVSDPEEVAKLMQSVVSTFGGLDIAHNNAGILGQSGNAVSCTTAEWDRVIAVNLSSVWYCIKQEIPLLQLRGGGAIVNTSSIGGMFAAHNSTAYMAAKHGVIGLTRSAAIDFGPAGIRVNALLPGAVNTAMLGPAVSGASMAMQEMVQRIPLRRIAEPKEQADAVLWLCSAEASFVTGIALIVDGGITMQV